MLAPPPAVTIPLVMNTLVRKDGSQAPLRVTISTLHEPSNGAACAVEAKETAQAAKAVTRVTARIELLSMGDPRVGLMAPSPSRRRVVVITCAFSSSWAWRSSDSRTAQAGMVSRTRVANEGALLGIGGAQMGCESTRRKIMLLWAKRVRLPAAGRAIPACQKPNARLEERHAQPMSSCCSRRDRRAGARDRPLAGATGFRAGRKIRGREALY